MLVAFFDLGEAGLYGKCPEGPAACFPLVPGAVCSRSDSSMCCMPPSAVLGPTPVGTLVGGVGPSRSPVGCEAVPRTVALGLLEGGCLHVSVGPLLACWWARLCSNMAVCVALEAWCWCCLLVGRPGLSTCLLGGVGLVVQAGRCCPYQCPCVRMNSPEGCCQSPGGVAVPSCLSGRFSKTSKWV